MTDEAKALVEQTINVARKIVEEEYLQLMAEMTQRHMEAALKARNEQNSIIEALSAENERLREVLTQIEAGTYPRPLGKSWRMDLSSSKHDLCIHDRWMYETCDECLDAFVRAALGETK